MADIILNLSGQGGLANNFAGDTDMVTPRPEIRTNVQEGQLAQGKFNPYFRQGYLAPVVTNSTVLTLDVALDTVLTSEVVDTVTKAFYFAEQGRKIYKGDSLSDTSLVNITTLDTGFKVNDLEIYTVNSERKLMYVYTKDEGFFSLRAPIVVSWQMQAVEIKPDGVLPVTIEGTYSNYGTFTDDIDVIVPAKNGCAAIVEIRNNNAAPTDVNLDGVAMTLVSTVRRGDSGSDFFCTTYYLGDLTPGTKPLVVTGSASSPVVTCTLVSEAAAIAVDRVTSTDGTGTVPEIKYKTIDNALYIVSAFNFGSYYNLSTTTAETTYSGQRTITGSSGFALGLGDGGTKLYIDGGGSLPFSIFQYNLSSAYVMTSAAFASKSFAYTGTVPGRLGGIKFSPDGLNLYIREWSGNSIFYHLNLSTAWDISTASFSGDTLDNTEYGSTGYSFDFSKDGLRIYAAEMVEGVANVYNIVMYTLTTPWDISTGTYTSRFETLGDSTYSVALGDENNLLYTLNGIDDTVTQWYFNPFFPNDVTKLRKSGQTRFAVSAGFDLIVRPDRGSLYYRDSSVGDINTLNVVLPSSAEFINSQNFIYDNESDFPKFKAAIVGPSQIVDIGHSNLTGTLNTNTSYLSDTLQTTIPTKADYNFLRVADNGFAYLFAQNAVHKIDGGITGGKNGLITKNVLLFPEYFTITDAVDYRASLYMAVQQYPLSSANTINSTFSGQCSIIIWDRQSTQLGGVTTIEIPGVKEIKKIYKSPDGLIKIITISDNGLTQVRAFGYNDSGGVTFAVVKTLGIGAYPAFPDGVSIAGDKATWLANDGNIYCEKGGAVTQLFSIEAPGVTTDSLVNNIKSGALIYGSDVEVASNGYRTNKQAFTFSYQDSGGLAVRKIYPFDLTNGSNTAQSSGQGDVYSGVTLIPTGSSVKTIRVYNAPTQGTGDTVVATVKVYFNQGTSATSPDGMTKSISMDEARRGYVDFKINKQYVHAIQIEVEWATAIPLGENTYLPSVAIINSDDTRTLSADNG